MVSGWCLGGVLRFSGGFWVVSGECLGASGGVWVVLDGVWMVLKTLLPIQALCAPPPCHTGIQDPVPDRVKHFINGQVDRAKTHYYSDFYIYRVFNSQ